MTVVSMQGFRPPPRYDSQTWRHMKIEEAAASTGSWTQIEDKDLAVSPYSLDIDPTNPQARDWTTELAVQAPGVGWYRVRFADLSGDHSEYSAPVQNDPIDWLPTLRQVAAHIKTRTVERDTSKFAGTFTNQTRPNDDETWEVIGLAESDVIAAIGAPDAAAISANGQKAIRSVISLRAAMIVERSYYSEQVGTNKSSYPALERDWERMLPQLIEAIKEDLAGDIEPGESSATAATEQDHVVPSGSRVLTKAGVWLGEGDAQYSFPDDTGGMIAWETDF